MTLHYDFFWLLIFPDYRLFTLRTYINIINTSPTKTTLASLMKFNISNMGFADPFFPGCDETFDMFDIFTTAGTNEEFLARARVISPLSSDVSMKNPDIS
ncbi:MAG: hypothetical protein L6282_17075, partial [Candidatus Methanoperedenaceae archaeon]|nr:hypothetical protein [Candidatus Methanoperedenaceae archaeon]